MQDKEVGQVMQDKELVVVRACAGRTLVGAAQPSRHLCTQS